MLVKTAGVQRLVVVVNKMDDPSVNWEKERFDEIVNKLSPFLKVAGFNPKTDVQFIPVSAYSGANLKDNVTEAAASWYDGMPLLPYLDSLDLGDRKMSESLKLPVSEKYADMGTYIVGKLESGKVKKGDSLVLMPNRTPVEAAGIFSEADEEISAAVSGDNVRIKLKGVEIEADVIVANILADILIHLTEDAYRLVKDEGYLIMSGIIKDKWDMVRESAESAGFFLETHMIQGEWNACVFKKTKDISGVIGG